MPSSVSTAPAPPDSSERRRAATASLPSGATEDMRPEPASDWSFLEAKEPEKSAPGTRTQVASSGNVLVRPEIPGYELLEELGRGGMGVVYKARQSALNRLVALKMILAGPFAGKEDRARFFAEAEIIAKLRHPNIVQIHDFGERQGVPYFSLEFMEGGTLHRWLHAERPAPAIAAAVVERLARAMDYAHRQGVIHRDLKPSNVLLSGGSSAAADGLVPKLTDFGLAKREAANLTLSGAVLGTPNYMAPEQARAGGGPIGVGVDIYGLGAILYELLAGRPPFIGATSFDIINQVLTREPPPPSSFRSGLPRDLETICLTCLQKEPGKRYANASLLADDLSRYLKGEPILARRTGVWERTRLWVRRNPIVAGLTAALLVGFLALTVLAALLLANVSRLSAAVKTADQERIRADANLLKARETVRRFFVALTHEGLGRVGGTQSLRKELLEEAAAYLKGFLKDNAGRVELQLDLAQAEIMLARVLREQGQAEAARIQAEKILAKLQAQPAAFAGNDDYAVLLGRAQNELGWAQNRGPQRAEAAAAHRQAIATLRPLAEREPPHLVALEEIVQAEQALASSAYDQGDSVGSLDQLRKAEAGCRRLLRTEPGKLHFVYLLARCLLDQALLLRDRGEMRQSRQLLEESLALLDSASRLGQLRPEHVEAQAILCSELAQTHASLDESQAAFDRANQALRLFQVLLEGPQLPEHLFRTAKLHSDRGEVFWKAGQNAPAAADYQEALRYLGRVMAQRPDDPESQALKAMTLSRWGELLCEDPEKRADGVAKLRQARASFLTALEQLPKRLDLMELLCRVERLLAKNLREAGQLEEAQQLLEECLRRRGAFMERARGDQDRLNEYASAAAELGHVRFAGKNAVQALASYRFAAELLGQEKSPAPVTLYNQACYLAQAAKCLSAQAGQPTPAAEKEADAAAAAAISCLRRALQAGFPNKPLVGTDADLDPLRNRPEFQALLEEFKIPKPPGQP